MRSGIRTKIKEWNNEIADGSVNFQLIIGVCHVYGLCVSPHTQRLGTLMRRWTVSCRISSQTWISASVSSCGPVVVVVDGTRSVEQVNNLHHPKSADSLKPDKAKHIHAPELCLEHFKLILSALEKMKREI